MQGYATLHDELDALESRQKHSDHVIQHTLLDVDEYHTLLEDAQLTLWTMTPENLARTDDSSSTTTTLESVFEFDRRMRGDDAFSDWARSSTISSVSAGVGTRADLDEDVASEWGKSVSEWGRSSIMSSYSIVEEEKNINVAEVLEELELEEEEARKRKKEEDAKAEKLVQVRICFLLLALIIMILFLPSVCVTGGVVRVVQLGCWTVASLKKAKKKYPRRGDGDFYSFIHTSLATFST